MPTESLIFTIDVVRQYLIIYTMIKSFKCKKTAQLFKGERVPAFSGFARQADKRLRILDAAETLEALKALPSNRFESLSLIEFEINRERNR